MILEFICGCRHEIRTNDLEDVGWWKEVSQDREGFLICVKHRKRRRNYASLPEGGGKHLSDWRFAGTTPLEREQYFIFGKELPQRSLVEIDFGATEDARDNRDPEEIGREILAAHTAEGNGNAE